MFRALSSKRSAAEAPGTDLYPVSGDAGAVGEGEGKSRRSLPQAVPGLRHDHPDAQEDGGKRLADPLPLQRGRAGGLCGADRKRMGASERSKGQSAAGR